MAELGAEAAAEMALAAAWYERRRDGLGDRFLDVVQTTILRIDEAPLTGTRWQLRRLPAVVRRQPVPGFPFFIVYVTEPAVVIVAIAHMHRRPGYWRVRLSHLR